MKKTILSTLAIIFLAVGVSACRTAPVYNVHESQLMASDNVSIDQVTSAIMRAGGSLGWQMKKVDDGHILGVLALRSHSATVDINYDTEAFSIMYKDSIDLKYDGTSIHSNYNGWIQNLENAIRAQAMTL